MFDRDRGQYELPEWLEPLREYLPESERVEELMSGKPSTITINAPMALIECGLATTIHTLARLYDAGKLLDESGTALVLTQEEWDDLAYIVRVWRLATENTEGTTEQEMTMTLRRRSLADRILEAA